jgi:hypothetical protein
MGRGTFDPRALRERVARHQAGENHSERLWALVTLEMWQRQFVDGETAPAGDLAPAESLTAA